MPKPLSYDQALSRMAALCSTSEHCESEIREKLQRAAVAAPDADRIVDFLYDGAYLDTARYCRAFSHDKLCFDHWGRLKIAQALRMKGLPSSDITAALDELPEDDYRSILRALLEQKARSLGFALGGAVLDDGETAVTPGAVFVLGGFPAESEYALRAKLFRFATARGFTYDEIESLMP